MVNTLKLPVGIDSFEKIRRNGFYYIDKTNLIEQIDGSCSVYGENFTKQTKIYINGEKQATTFLNNTRVDLKKSELKDGDIVQAAQVGSSNTIFRTSVKYEYKDGKLTELPTEETEVEVGRNAFVTEETKEDK